MYDRLGDLLNESLKKGYVDSSSKESPKDNPPKDSQKNFFFKDSPLDSHRESDGESDKERVSDLYKNSASKKYSAEKIFKSKNDNKKFWWNFTSADNKAGNKAGKEKISAEEKIKIFRPQKNPEKTITPQIERALRLLGLNSDFNEESLRKAYKEKLNIYHPDKNSKTPVVQKVAADKTRQVLEAYRLLLDFINS
ncbi:J domain-containing protein [Treponema sp.]|uniref:J domain-containing protein n=1 Tax=Treponema sp. TaxID=166 RepID=UPI0025F0A57F|nr:J domain-containing protein [Treponema sp.]